MAGGERISWATALRRTEDAQEIPLAHGQKSFAQENRSRAETGADSGT
jgi:hypothetical protein